MAEAAYRRVAEALRAEIEAGTPPPGQALPTVEAIAKRFKVSKQTAHNAIRSLANEGVINVVRRQGTFVRDRPRERAVIRDRNVYRDEIGYFFDRNAQNWRAVGKPSHRIEAPPNHIADLLGTPRGDNVLIRDRSMGPKEATRASQIAISYLPLSVVAEVPAVGGTNTGPGGIYDRIEEHYQVPIEWFETVSGREANAEEEERLGVRPGASVLVVTRESRVRAGGRSLVVEVNETRMSAEEFAVSYAVQRDASAAWPRSEEGSVS
ncbi:GntR family transcriptional regulator (plasmid) [Streptomyces sp. LZ34]